MTPIKRQLDALTQTRYNVAMNYYKVAPLTHLANADGLLTYSYDGELSRGALVSISLRTGKKQAVIIEGTSKPDFNTKDITSVISEIPVVSEIGIKLAEFISREYFCTFGEALATVLPVIFGKKRRKTEIIATTETKEQSYTLTGDQQKVFDSIKKEGTSKPHLLFGITGSGKTEIYLQLIDEALKAGKGAIVLVPEISLTPQTVARFRARFGNTVALLHSNMKETEKYAEWQNISEGKKMVIIGPRSALFAPVRNLGVIIIDEAHESSYKQDSTPRYQAVKVAEELSKLSGAYLILGSATPSVEQLYRGYNKQYVLHNLNNRIVQSSMPSVEIVDMRNEFHFGNCSIFSEKLQSEIKDTLARKRQVLLFLNRRGMSTFVSCRDCGHVEKCPHCDIPLTFHYADLSLRCHHCEFTKTAPTVCPECRSLAIKYFGSGTERVEQEILKLFGKEIRTVRMDSDTTNTRNSHKSIFDSIKAGHADIIIGTQMIAKGWDIVGIDLIGVISADSILNLPDYSAEERAFSLLVQVAGRAGRGTTPGNVVVQTYNPDLDIFRFLCSHDYVSFYNKAILEREMLKYPPFSKIVSLLYNNADDSLARETSQKAVLKLKKALDEASIPYQLIGPAPSFIPKLRGKYRWQIILKLPDWDITKTEILSNIIAQVSTNGWAIDVDPNGL